MRTWFIFGSWIALACVTQNALAGTITGYSFTTLDDPYALPGTTGAFGINDAGQIVGGFVDANGVHGFIYDGSTWTTVDNNPLLSGAPVTISAINDSGQAVGDVEDAFSGHAALYDGTSWTLLPEAPNAVANSTIYTGINDYGVLSGVYHDSSATHSFLYDGGAFTLLEPPSVWQASTPVAFGLNDAGTVTGFYNGRLPTGPGFSGTPHGFVFDGTTWSAFDAPDPLRPPDYEPLATEPYAINDTGLVAGIYRDANSNQHGFVYDGTVFTEFDVPNSVVGSTFVGGINDAGTIIGRFVDATGPHAFIGTPVTSVPEPSPLSLVGGGLLVLGFMKRRRLRAIA